MGLWIFQIGFDFLMLAIVFAWVAQRRKIKELEFQIQNTAPKEDKQIMFNTPLGATTSTLSETSTKESVNSIAGYESYEKAEEMLAKGMKIQEVALKTGLSLSELQLIGKVSQRNH